MVGLVDWLELIDWLVGWIGLTGLDWLIGLVDWIG